VARHERALVLIGVARPDQGAGRLGPATPASSRLAVKPPERYVAEWLNVKQRVATQYDPASGRYTLPPSKHMRSPTREPGVCPGLFQVTKLLSADEKGRRQLRRGGGTLGRPPPIAGSKALSGFFSRGYIGNLVGSWIPALDGVLAKLEQAQSRGRRAWLLVRPRF